jgi:serine protease inhibitor
MLIILPRKAEDFEAVEKTFDCDMFSWIKERLSFFGEPPQELVVGMPVLNIQKKYSLKAMIPKNLSIICERMNLEEIHQSNFRVSWRGAVHLNNYITTFGKKYNIPKTSNYITIEGFNIKHPFLYLITDSRSGAILLMGRFTGE